MAESSNLEAQPDLHVGLCDGGDVAQPVQDFGNDKESKILSPPQAFKICPLSCNLCEGIVSNIRAGVVYEKRHLCLTSHWMKPVAGCLICDAMWLSIRNSLSDSVWLQSKAIEYVDDVEWTEWAISISTYIEGTNYVLVFDCDYLLNPELKMKVYLSAVKARSLDGQEGFADPILYLEMDYSDETCFQCPSIVQIPRNIGHPSCSTAVKQWLQDCEKTHTHPSCQSTSTSAPSRLLDLSTSDIVKLKTEFSIPSPYAALSHCWGGSIACKTTLENFHSRIEGLPISSLPQNFIDAITVARSLDLSYLWIDSLCIIQDDREDWAKESAKMASVYMHATVTISADRSSSSSEGFLGHRMPPSWVIDFDKPEAQLLGFGLYKLRDYWKNDPHGDRRPYEHLQDQPLQKRAWSLQEHRLSRRIIHYTEGLRIWECQQEINGEGRLKPTITTIPLWILSPESSMYSWYDDVRDYTTRELTEESDKLPALSGLASRFHSNHHEDAYYAGIWESSLIYGLLWISHWRGRRTPPKFYRAPSWSWAAVNNEVRFFIHRTHTPYFGPTKFRAIAICNGIKVKPSTTDPFGQVESGEISLTGPCFVIKDFAGFCRERNICVELTIRWASNPYFSFDCAERHPEGCKEVMLLVLAEVKGIYEEGWSFEGLILELLVDGRWKRLGTFSASKAKIDFQGERTFLIV